MQIKRARQREFRALLAAFPICVLCRIEQSNSQHHLYPREIVRRLSAFPPPGSTLRANGSFCTPKIAVCRRCHNRIHAEFMNEELYHRINTTELLRAALFEQANNQALPQGGK